MSTHPYIPLYVDDYDAATAHLTPEEDGIYGRLIRLTWRTPGCSLPNDPAWIARKIRLSAADFDRIAKPVIEEFFSLQRGRLAQRRLKREYDDISRKKTARKTAGKKGGEAKARKTKENEPSIAIDLLEDMRAFPEPEPEPEPVVLEVGGVERERASLSTDWPEGDGHQLAKILVEAAASPWLDPAKSLKLTTTLGRLLAWKREGASWALDVVPTVTGVCAFQHEPIGSWTFFDKAIARSIATNRAALEIPEAGSVVPFRNTGPPRQSRTERNDEGWEYAIARIAADE